MKLKLLPAATHRNPLILMYHGIPRFSAGTGDVDAETFEAQIIWLKREHEIITPTRLRTEREGFGRPKVLLTFDDGFRNNWNVAVPVLRRHGVPATFFISSRHSQPGEYLWFVYLRALRDHFKGHGFRFQGEYQRMSDGYRDKTVRRLLDILIALRPHPAAMYDVIKKDLPPLEEFVNPQDIASKYAGMTAEQVRELASDPLFSIGVHTVDHPLLSRCAREEAIRQVSECRAWLENISGKQCRWIAYPGGDYNHEILNICREAGLLGGFAVNPKFDSSSPWEMPRVGVYCRNLALLELKVALGTALTTSWLLRAYSNMRARIRQPEI
jgi:peptidoglycan/xylan/chitin deacetylase (PgdA/CDA1 family)